MEKIDKLQEQLEEFEELGDRALDAAYLKIFCLEDDPYLLKSIKLISQK